MSDSTRTLDDLVRAVAMQLGELEYNHHVATREFEARRGKLLAQLEELVRATQELRGPDHG